MSWTLPRNVVSAFIASVNGFHSHPPFKEGIADAEFELSGVAKGSDAGPARWKSWTLDAAVGDLTDFDEVVAFALVLAAIKVDVEDVADIADRPGQTLVVHHQVAASGKAKLGRFRLGHASHWCRATGSTLALDGGEFQCISLHAVPLVCLPCWRLGRVE